MSRIYKIVILLLVASLTVQSATAFGGFLTDFKTKYPTTVGTKLDSCILCHTNPNPSDDGSRNSYGLNFEGNDRNFTTIEQLDSDNDTFINIDEINNLTFPGNSSDFPIEAGKTFNISGFKINDSTGIGIPEWNITLSNETMQINDSTEDDGSYNFDELNNGTYTVTEEMKDGFTNVTPISVEVTINGDDISGINFTNKVIGVGIVNFAADMVGKEEVPSVENTFARGNAAIDFNGIEIKFRVEIANITNVTASHIHMAPVGVNGPIVANLFLGPTKEGRFDGMLAEGTIRQEDLVGPLAGMPLDVLIQNMTSGNTYVNAHTTQNPGGEIRGQIKAGFPDMRFSISGFKLNNLTGNGIGNWNIMLKNETEEIIDTMLTNVDGSYRFAILANGTYNVTEEMKDGFTPVGDIFQIVTINGQNVDGINFTNIPEEAEEKKFTISGFKINDTGEGIENWNITINNDTMQDSTLTGIDGSYKFENLINGTYNITEETKEGFTNVTSTSVQVTIEGQDVTGINFTNRKIPVTISNFIANLKGSEEVPPVDTFATGGATFNLVDGTLKFKVNVENITNATASHIHLASVGVNGPVVVNLFIGPTKDGRFDGVLAEGEITVENLTGPLSGMSFDVLIDNMTAGNTYVNVHTTQNPGGEIRGQIRLIEELAEIKEFKVGNGNRAGSILANATITNLDIEPHNFVVVIGGVNSSTGFPLVGTGTVRLEANQTIRVPVLISVPASTQPGQYELFAGIFPFDNEVLDPNAPIGTLVGPEISTVS